MKISNLPYKGCNDYLPNDFDRLKYIFDTWRKVAKRYAYKEYLTPVLENAEIYEAKSGEDIKKELFTLTDSANRRLALRPEMTPSITRLVTQIYNGVPKPIRLFSIANFFRGERPQKGRDREFWQLNVDIFGDNSIYADIEIIQSALDLMLEFGAQKDQFILKINHRNLINFLLENILQITDVNQKSNIIRKMDKFAKLNEEEFKNALKEFGLIEAQIDIVYKWMKSDFDDLINNFPGIDNSTDYIELQRITSILDELGYKGLIKYSTDLIRGFDYYDGVIFEVFDLHPDFNRSLFGGGRYNGLANIFGYENLPAVGYAPGSPISFFLDNWNLWPDFKDKITNIFVPMLLLEDQNNFTLKLIAYLRKLEKSENTIYELGTSKMDLNKALNYANKRNFEKMIILGENELSRNIYIVKDMQSGNQAEYPLNI
jgi:histidyl-tRNA synthetase